MKILIIGNDSTIAKRLFNNLSPNHELITAGIGDNTNIYFDLLKLDNNFEDLPNFDIIIHCAASFLDNSIDNMIKNEIINSIGSLQVCKLAEISNCKHIVYLSSIFTLDHPENVFFNSYGLSKKHGQDNIEFFCKNKGINYTSLLLSQVFDEKGEAKKHQGFLYQIIDQASKGLDINIYGNKDPLRNFIFIQDVVKIIEKVIEKGINGSYYVVSPKTLKLSEISQIALNIFNKGGKVIFLKDKPDVPSIYVPQKFELYDLIDYYPQIDIEEGIRLIKKEQKS